MRLSKSIIALMAGGLVLTGCVTLPPRVSAPNTFEDWYTGTGWTNTQGASQADMSYLDNPGGRVAKFTYSVAKGGYACFWHSPSPNNPADLSGVRSLKFKAKATLPQYVMIFMQDANQQYWYSVFQISSADFTDVTVPLYSFLKDTDPNVVPPPALQGRPMNLSQCPVFQFCVTWPGTGVIMVGPIMTSTENPYEEKYKAALEAYQASGGKMALPEEARKYFVQAEAAVGDKNYDGAVNFYYQGLVEAAWYPQAHYNLAILLAEHENKYPEAVEEMKKYLELNPKASDARAAQDKIYVWESKGQ